MCAPYKKDCYMFIFALRNCTFRYFPPTMDCKYTGYTKKKEEMKMLMCIIVLEWNYGEMPSRVGVMFYEWRSVFKKYPSA